MSKMEMKSQEERSDLPAQPPPYSPQEPHPVINPAVIVVPPTFNTSGSTVTFQNTSVPVQSTIVAGNIVVPNHMTPVATPYHCPSCKNMIVTRVEASTTVKQHLFALLLFCIGFWPCMCIPYCMPSCRRADHYCPVCNSYIGSYF